MSSVMSRARDNERVITDDGVRIGAKRAQRVVGADGHLRLR